MLPKKNRATTKDVEQIFKSGRFINSTHLSFKFLRVNAGKSKKISFIVPKSTAKSAVKRNFYRRRGYRALLKNLEYSPTGIIGAFILKSKIEEMLELENEIKGILNKIN